MLQQVKKLAGGGRQLRDAKVKQKKKAQSHGVLQQQPKVANRESEDWRLYPMLKFLQQHIVDLHKGLYSSSGFHQNRLKDSLTQEGFVEFCTDRQQASTNHLKGCMLTCFNLLKISSCSERFPKSWLRDIQGCECALDCVHVILQLGQEVRYTQIGCTSLGSRTFRDWLVSLEDCCNAPPVQSACRGCFVCTKETMLLQHPIFKGLHLCKTCERTYTSHIWTEDSSRFEESCRICSFGGRLVKCCKPGCAIAHCEICLCLSGGHQAYSDIVASDSWQCWVCSGNMLEGAVVKSAVVVGAKSMSDGRPERPKSFSCAQQHGVAKWLEHNTGALHCNLSSYSTERAINVLSVFDGIGGAVVALREAGFKGIGSYFSSEIDSKAQTIVDGNNGGEHSNIEHFNDEHCDVTKLTEEKLEEMAKERKIDLLIGGSPCVDLACCKRGKEGLHGPESSLFFEFVRILNFFRDYYAEHDSGHKLFFMLENTASMNRNDTYEMTDSLGVAPLQMNAEMITPCRRDRLYWINWEVSAFKKKGDATLKAMLNEMQGNSAVPLHDKGYCIRAFSGFRTDILDERSAFSMKDMTILRIRPDSDRFRGLTTAEKAKCLGFPNGYIDNGGASDAEKSRFLGKTFSIPVVAGLLKPLVTCFKQSSGIGIAAPLLLWSPRVQSVSDLTDMLLWCRCRQS